MDLIYNGKNGLSSSFFIFKNYGCNYWGVFKKGSFLGNESAANTWGDGGRARGQKLLQTLSYSIFLFLYQVISTPLSILCASKVATELRFHSFTLFWIIMIFYNLLDNFKSLESNENHPTFFLLEK